MVSDTVVARLRERIETERDAQGLGIGLDAVAVDLDDLEALLDVVEGFAATENRVLDECVYCREYGPCAEGCRHAAARRLCGMEAAK